MKKYDLLEFTNERIKRANNKEKYKIGIKYENDNPESNVLYYYFVGEE